jgi:hypothetical protein
MFRGLASRKPGRRIRGAADLVFVARDENTILGGHEILISHNVIPM